MGEAPDQLREDIEETRARMGERAEALAYKADVPARSKDKVHDLTDRIKEKVTGMGQTVSGTSHDAAGSVKDRAHGASDKVGDTAHKVGDGAQRAKGLAESNPLGLAIGAIAVGFLAGLAVPATRVEQEKLGPVAEQARAKAQEVGGQLADRTKDAAHAAQDAVKDEVSSNS
ncbi:DUF3618 domain-containing protein [Aquipuribacter sp. MA13-6]|uniref:DUF3618 domain-containing protein n=1 Tax=unclassified Aquipuribacter TaxID=2635084 RepID=UPI003EED4200